MIAGELAHLAGEMDAAIGQQDFGFADAAGIKNDLAGRGIAGVVLVRDAEIEIAERHPDPLAAPAHMDRLTLERHRLAKGRAGFGRQLFLETGLKREVSGADNELAHTKFSGLGAPATFIAAEYTGSKEHSSRRPNPGLFTVRRGCRLPLGAGQVFQSRAPRSAPGSRRKKVSRFAGNPFAASRAMSQLNRLDRRLRWSFPVRSHRTFSGLRTARGYRRIFSGFLSRPDGRKSLASGLVWSPH